MTLKFHRWPSKTIGHFFPVLSSFMYHFAAISDFKFRLRSGNAQIASNLTIFCPLLPRNFKDDLENWWSTSPITIQALCITSYPLVNLDLSYSPETLKLGRIWSFFPPVTLKLFGWLWKPIRHLFYTNVRFRHHFIAVGEFQSELQSRNRQIGFWPLWPWPLISDLDLLHGHNCCHW